MIGYASHRNLLVGIAYRMLGQASDAEDIVQEAFVRLGRVPPDEIRDAKAYLARIVTRLCLDHLRSSRVRRERIVDELPEPVDDDTAHAMMCSVELADSLSIAFIVLLKSLSPTERAVFLLREVFDFDYDAVAAIVGKSVSTCRQIVHRAREHVAARRPRFDTTAEQTTRAVEAFAAACASGDLDQLIRVLAPDVILYTDGGEGDRSYGSVRALRRPLQGVGPVSKFAIAVQAQAPAETVAKMHAINGEAALLTYVEGQLRAVLSFDVEGDRIRAIFVNSDETKLAGLGPLRFLT